MIKLIPKNKRLIESINASKEDISDLYYVVMLYNLLKHSLSIMSVFRKTFLIRSALFIILYILFIKSNASIITAFPLVLLLIAVYSISNLSLRENFDEFKDSLSKINDISKIK